MPGSCPAANLVSNINKKSTNIESQRGHTKKKQKTFFHNKWKSLVKIIINFFIQFRREIRDDTAKKCVYPNRLIIPMSGSVDPMQIKCFEPTGLVAVKILNASGLPRKKGIRTMVGQVSNRTYNKLGHFAKNVKQYYYVYEG